MSPSLPRKKTRRSHLPAITWGQPFVDRGAQASEKHYQECRMGNLKSHRDQFGFELTPKTAIAGIPCRKHIYYKPSFSQAITTQTGEFNFCHYRLIFITIDVDLH
jgi:hypothetical protein